MNKLKIINLINNKLKIIQYILNNEQYIYKHTT